MHTSPKSNSTSWLTIPNLLSLVRIILIPIFMWAYCVKKDSTLTAVLLLASGLTDSLDGIIARKFNMISDLGKALDPIADKLTQGTMLLCLITRYPLMLLPFILLLIKEASVGITSLVVIRKTGAVHGAVWHGKITTCLLYAMMVLHVLWNEIPLILSNATIWLCSAMMLSSFVLYILRNISFLRKGAENS